MKITSESFNDNDSVPGRNAFGIPDPDDHMALGGNLNPQLSWSDVPVEACSLILFCIDPDVPSSADDVNQEGKVIPASLPRVDFFHWIMVDLPASDDGLAEGECSQEVTPSGKVNPAGPPGTRQGVNNYTDFLAGNKTMGGEYRGYDGPCPPWNDEILHHYHFRLYAIDLEKCPVEDGFRGPEVLSAIEGHVVAEAEIVGTYSLNPALSG